MTSSVLPPHSRLSPLGSAIGLFLAIVLLSGTSPEPAAAQDRGVLRHLDRVSLSVTGGYHLNPWDDYNGALETVTRHIERDVFFPQPRGQYDEIRGDVSGQATLGIRVFRGLRVLLVGQYGGVGSDFETFTDTTGLPELERRNPAHHQTMDFRVRSLGVGLSYPVPLTGALAVEPKVTVGRYRAQLDLSWRHFRNAEGRLSEDSDAGRSLSASVDDRTWGFRLGLDVSWELFSNVSLLAGVQYRSAVFDQMQGPASGRGVYWRDGKLVDNSFTVELVEAANYFGVRPTDMRQDKPEEAIRLPPLTFLTEPDEEAREPTSIDLNSFGVRAGFRVNL